MMSSGKESGLRKCKAVNCQQLNDFLAQQQPSLCIKIIDFLFRFPDFKSENYQQSQMSSSQPQIQSHHHHAHPAHLTHSKQSAAGAAAVELDEAADKAAKNRTHQALTDTIHMYTTKVDDPLSFAYEVECAALSTVEFTLDFAGSINFNFFPSDGAKFDKNSLKIVCDIRPFSRKDIGKVVIDDEDRRAALKLNCTWLLKEPDQAELQK
jgi:hypothetical protein